MYSEFRDSASCSNITQFYETTNTTISYALEVVERNAKRRFTEFLLSNHQHLQAEEVAIFLSSQLR